MRQTFPGRAFRHRSVTSALVTTVEPDGRPLIGRHVRLDAASLDDAPALFGALDDERVWAAGYAGGPGARPRDVAEMQAFLQAGLDAAVRRQRPAYVVRLVAPDVAGTPAGTVVGTTSLADWDVSNERAHIGWTAYGPPWWGGPVNPECKLLLLAHAFDDCGFGRVKLQTDLINDRSQAAIAKLGATREGVLRRHQRRADGTFRDTVVFSVLAEEWPTVRAGLEARIA
jgi:RimJ/RimL family protein N-acetyltransferase